jgi:ABC-type phosphate transport system substrate-binding protein
MKKRNLILIACIILSGLAACNQVPQATTPSATFEVINLQLTPELEGWTPRINQCVNAIGGIGVYTDFVTQGELDISQTDLVLRLGQRENDDPSVAVLGMEEIVIVAGRNVPIDNLSIESVRAIFNETVTNWREVPEIQQQGSDFDSPIQTLSYPQGHILRDLFSTIYLQYQPIHGQPIVYSTPKSLTSALQENPDGIGYLLKSHTSKEHSILTISPNEDITSQVFVLAVTAEAPQGKLKQLLLCLQNAR